MCIHLMHPIKIYYTVTYFWYQVISEHFHGPLWHPTSGKWATLGTLWPFIAHNSAHPKNAHTVHVASKFLKTTGSLRGLLTLRGIQCQFCADAGGGDRTSGGCCSSGLSAWEKSPQRPQHPHLPTLENPHPPCGERSVPGLLSPTRHAAHS